MSRLSKICLLVIALSLALIALRTVMRPQSARAANHYKPNWQPEAIQEVLNKRAAEGWELAAPVYLEGRSSVDLIFRQEAR